MKQVLTIAGSDSGGGAGIQADIKAMSANGVFAMSAITAITAQNTEEVTDVFELPVSIIAAQIDAVFDDFEVAAVKTGMLSSAEIVRVVAKLLKPQNVTNLVVDPVMVSKSGHPLLKPDAIEAVIKELIPLALVVTPNIHEAQQLSGIEIKTLGESPPASFGRRLPPLTSGARAVFKRAVDEARPSRSGRIDTTHFLLALLSLQRPDPAAELLDAIGVDPAAVRKHVGGPAEGEAA